MEEPQLPQSDTTAQHDPHDTTTTTATPSTAVPAKPLPVTLLSGFLGSGKTTLLQHILTHAQGLRIAVIVNDIGAINIDARLIRTTHTLARTHERLVELQNGCICCTLRGDLVEKLVELATAEGGGRFDYVLVESSGISEPEQVAETFDPRLAAAMAGEEGVDEAFVGVLELVTKAGGMEKFARLDTTVTVIDAFSFYEAFNTADMLSTRRDDVDEDDERHVSHLMVDQIEFAEVVILNKVDSVSRKTKEGIVKIIKSLNHRADIIETNYGKVDVRLLMNTSRFDMEVAQTGAGWLQDLNELVKINVNGRNTVAPRPETEEYGISNFVYTRRRPLHPRRLFDLIHDKFIMEDTVEGLVGAEDEEMEDAAAEEDAEAEDGAKGATDDEATPAVPDKATILKNKQNSTLFSRLFRSKGGFWLATRPHQSGDWSQAGAILSFQGGHEWYCRIPRDQWSGGNEELDALIEADCVEPWGDRQQQIVFIGERLDQKGIEEELDKCLLNEEEMQTFVQIMGKTELTDEELAQQLMDAFDDGFPEWALGEDEDEMDMDGHQHGDHRHNNGHLHKHGSSGGHQHEHRL